MRQHDIKKNSASVTQAVSQDKNIGDYVLTYNQGVIMAGYHDHVSGQKHRPDYTGDLFTLHSTSTGKTLRLGFDEESGVLTSIQMHHQNGYLRSKEFDPLSNGQVSCLRGDGVEIDEQLVIQTLKTMMVSHQEQHPDFVPTEGQKKFLKRLQQNTPSDVALVWPVCKP